MLKPEDSWELMKAVSEPTSAECADCGTHFTNWSEGREHERMFPLHTVLFKRDRRAVN